MDHYPYPAEPIFPPAEVPYLNYRTPYDGGDFFSFPTRSGWDKQMLLKSNTQTENSSLSPYNPEPTHQFDPLETAGFLQNWLFFGLASAVLQLPPRSHFFFLTENSAGKKVLTTKDLRIHVERWQEQVLSSDPGMAKRILEHAESILDEASVYSSATDGRFGNGFPLGSLYPEVHLSIICLGDYLWNVTQRLRHKLSTTLYKLSSNLAGAASTSAVAAAASAGLQKVTKKFRTFGSSAMSYENLYPTLHESKVGAGYMAAKGLGYAMGTMTAERVNEGILPYPPNWGWSELTAARMVEASWCPYEIRRALDVLSPWAAFFASALPRKHTANHYKCTEDFCGAYNVDESTYVTKHRQEGCCCPPFQPNQQEIYDILQAGGFPVIKVVLTAETNEIAFSVMNVDAVTNNMVNNTVAISHVWSHGLGNAQSNSLPQCQFVYFVRNFGRQNQESSGVYSKWIWIDTLCVPLDRHYRRLAISRLNMVYSNCPEVMVMDQELQQFSMVKQKDEEVLIRIILSTWMQRLWTFQEGGATFTLDVLFNDGPYCIDDGMLRLRTALPDLPIARGGELGDLMTQLRQSGHKYDTSRFSLLFRSLKDGKEESVMGPECLRISRAWNGLRWRAATKEGDQSIILATLLFGRTHLVGFNRPDELSFSKYKTNAKKLADVLETPKEKRWKKIYECIEYYPQGVIFVDCPTIPEKGLRWAPNAVGTYACEITDITPAHITPFGLVVKYPGFVFDPVERRLERSFEFLHGTSGIWYQINPVHSDQIDGWPAPTQEVQPQRQSFGGFQPPPFSHGVGYGNQKSHVLILRDMKVGASRVIAVMGTIEQAPPPPSSTSPTGPLIPARSFSAPPVQPKAGNLVPPALPPRPHSQLGAAATGIKVNFGCRVWVRKCPDVRSRELYEYMRNYPAATKGPYIVSATKYGEETKWCIG